jgi:hypothetical protein
MQNQRQVETEFPMTPAKIYFLHIPSIVYTVAKSKNKYAIWPIPYSNRGYMVIPES